MAIITELNKYAIITYIHQFTRNLITMKIIKKNNVINSDKILINDATNIKQYPRRTYSKKVYLLFIRALCLLIFIHYLSIYVQLAEQNIVKKWNIFYANTVSNLAIKHGFVLSIEPPKPFSIKRNLIKEMRVNQLSPALYPVLRGLIKRESGDAIYIESPAGAKGLMQLMPETTRKCGMTDPREAFIPEKNIECGVYWFREMLKSQNYNLITALKEYNAGRSRIDKTIENITYPKAVFESMLDLPAHELIYEEN